MIPHTCVDVSRAMSDYKRSRQAAVRSCQLAANYIDILNQRINQIRIRGMEEKKKEKDAFVRA